MKVIDWIFIGYFLIGFICGVIAVRAYTKEYGDSPMFIALFLCNLVAWWLAFPDQMLELRREKSKRRRVNIIGNTPTMDNIDFQEEVKKCMDSPAYFWNKYCKLVDNDGN